jgi:hypothetical protein
MARDISHHVEEQNENKVKICEVSFFITLRQSCWARRPARHRIECAVHQRRRRNQMRCTGSAKAASAGIAGAAGP